MGGWPVSVFLIWFGVGGGKIVKGMYIRYGAMFDVFFYNYGLPGSIRAYV